MINAREARIVTNESNAPAAILAREMAEKARIKRLEAEKMRRFEDTFKPIYDKIARAAANGKSSVDVSIQLPAIYKDCYSDIDVREMPMLQDLGYLCDAYTKVNEMLVDHFTALGYTVKPSYSGYTVKENCAFYYYGNYANWTISW